MPRPARQRMARKVIAVTDAKKGAARVTADKEGYKSFIIPDNVGGRFSVLIPAGLLPIAVAGIHIDQLKVRARWKKFVLEPEYDGKSCRSLATRNELYQNGKED